jgi:glyoxylate reductase
LGTSLINKTLGIVGLGRIGSMVARRAKGYNMTVFYNKKTRDEKKEKELGVQFANLEDLLARSDFVTMHVPLTEETSLLARSDFVTMHVPLTEETRHMINKETLAKMKKRSYFINTARGPVVDEHDLVEALRSGHLAGAALDVYNNEPNIDPELVGMENVILTPHIASATWEAREEMGEQAVLAILDTLKGEKPQNLVNEKVWEKRRK